MTLEQRLVRDLIDKETAVRDMIDDYKRGGNFLINRFKEDRQKEYEIYRAEKATAKATLMKEFKSIEEMCTMRASECKKSVTNLRRDWEAEQSEMNASIDAMLALCSEGT